MVFLRTIQTSQSNVYTMYVGPILDYGSYFYFSKICILANAIITSYKKGHLRFHHYVNYSAALFHHLDTVNDYLFSDCYNGICCACKDLKTELAIYAAQQLRQRIIDNTIVEVDQQFADQLAVSLDLNSEQETQDLLLDLRKNVIQPDHCSILDSISRLH